MSNSNFAAAVAKVANAPADEVFESTMQLFSQIQVMDENEVVSFWRAARSFYELNPGRNSGPTGVVKHMLETAWARMLYIYEKPNTGSCTQIKVILQTYSDNRKAA